MAYEYPKHCLCMIKIKQEFDPSTSEVVVNLQTVLVHEYPGVLEETWKASGIPESRYLVKAPGEIELRVKANSLSSSTERSLVSMSKDADQAILRFLLEFVSKSIREKVLGLEIIPLTGYPVEDIQGDVKKAVEAHRSLCVISDYQDYLESADKNPLLVRYNQVILPYGTDEYCNAVLSCVSGDLEGLKEQVSGKLRVSGWS